MVGLCILMGTVTVGSTLVEELFYKGYGKGEPRAIGVITNTVIFGTVIVSLVNFIKTVKQL